MKYQASDISAVAVWHPAKTQYLDHAQFMRWKCRMINVIGFRREAQVHDERTRVRVYLICSLPWARLGSDIIISIRRGNFVLFCQHRTDTS